MDEAWAYPKDFSKHFDTIFYGRKAYEKIGLPAVENSLQPIARQEFNEAVNGMRKYVFSRTLKHVGGNGMIINNHSMIGEVNRIRDEDGKSIWLCGGAEIINTFCALGLIDQISLAVHPVILGSGKSLFKTKERLKLKLIDTTTLKSGVVMMQYHPQRPVKIIADL